MIDNIFSIFILILVFLSSMSFLHIALLNIVAHLYKIDDAEVDQAWRKYPKWIRYNILRLCLMGSDIETKHFITKKKASVYTNLIGFIFMAFLYLMACIQEINYVIEKETIIILKFLIFKFPVFLILNIYQAYKTLLKNY